MQEQFSARPSMDMRCSLPSMAPQHTVHPVHKKALIKSAFYMNSSYF